MVMLLQYIERNIQGTELVFYRTVVLEFGKIHLLGHFVNGIGQVVDVLWRDAGDGDAAVLLILLIKNWLIN